MNKNAPSPIRIATMVIFTLSCFGLLLFLWLSFGGPIPLQPKGYRVQVAFPEATTLATEADVRVAGVSVGKVRKLELQDGKNKTLATIELESKFAPLAADARAILRQKTLLGETYVELTTGSPSAPRLKEGGRLADGQVASTVELDEIFAALDKPTRDAFRTWQKELATALRGGRAVDLNDSFGTLPRFVASGDDLVSLLNTQEGAVTRLVKNTGSVFGALTEKENQLSSLITSSDETFTALASQNDRLAESIRIFPTFLDESRLTLARLKTFALDTGPLVRDLRPVTRDLRPTLADLKALAPDLEKFFRDLDPLIDASVRGLPATSQLLRGTRPLLAALGPALQQLNPILQWLEWSQMQVSDFIFQGAAALSDTVHSRTGGVGHYLRQFGPLGAEALAIYQQRLPTNRGNSYFDPASLSGPPGGRYFTTPSFDCKNTGGPREVGDGQQACWSSLATSSEASWSRSSRASRRRTTRRRRSPALRWRLMTYKPFGRAVAGLAAVLAVAGASAAAASGPAGVPGFHINGEPRTDEGHRPGLHRQARQAPHPRPDRRGPLRHPVRRLPDRRG